MRKGSVICATVVTVIVVVVDLYTSILSPRLSLLFTIQQAVQGRRRVAPHQHPCSARSHDIVPSIISRKVPFLLLLTSSLDF